MSHVFSNKENLTQQNTFNALDIVMDRSGTRNEQKQKHGFKAI